MSHAIEITIGRKSIDGYWPLHVRISQPDKLTAHLPEMKFQLDVPNIKKESANEAEYGKLLGKAIFEAPFLKEQSGITNFSERLRRSLDSTGQKSLKILLSIDNAEDDELRTLHWQRLCAPLISNEKWSYLAQDRRTSFSMYIPTATSNRFPPLRKSQLRALVLVAGYDDPSEEDEIISDLRKVFGEDIPHTFLANGYDAPTLKNLSIKLTEAEGEKNPYTLLHIVSHGNFKKEENDTFLSFFHDDSEKKIVSGTDLINTLEERSIPYFTFLCVCNSADSSAEIAEPGKTPLGGLAQRLVRDLGMPAAIGMTRQITKGTAIPLASQFYSYLKISGEVDRSLNAATAGLENRHDIRTVPVLFSRLGERSLFIPDPQPLNKDQIQRGLKRLEKEILNQAPGVKVLKAEFETQKKLANAIDPETRLKASWELSSICYQLQLGITFDELAWGEKELAENKVIDECPFPGLSAFGKKDISGKRLYQKYFFRDQELIQSLETKLEASNFLTVYGPSGSGKSSLVLAGLLPKLEQEGYKVDDLTPGEKPIKKLNEKIEQLSKANRAVLVVDQFEELFTLCTKEKCNQFIDRILEFAQTQKVVITIRGDFLAECAYHSSLKDQVNLNSVLVAPMQPDDLRQAIQQQANAVGLRFESGLINSILAELEETQGIMPLLQYTLQLLYEERQGNWLSYDKYKKIGGVRQGIATTATKFFNNLARNEQQQVRHIFEQLTRIDEDYGNTKDSSRQVKPKDTSRRVKLNQLIAKSSNFEQTKSLVEKLTHVGLVISKANEVELAHETLILNWPQLVQWLDESRERLKIQQQIRPMIRRWKNHKDDRELLRSGLLEIAVTFLETTPDAFSKDEQGFIKVSQELPHRKPGLRKVLFTSCCITAAVFAVRTFGIMQPLELAAYDQMLRLKPSEPQDSRFLLIAVNDTDIQEQAKRKEPGVGTVKDTSLQMMLQKLKQYQPRVIGLDLLRDFPAQSKQLSDLLGKNDQLIGICTSPDGTSSGKGQKYPVDIAKEKVPTSVGFSNFIDDDVIRRQPLLNPVIEQALCPTENSFSFAIAQRYLNLKAKNKPYQPPKVQEGNYSEDLKFGQTSMKRRTGFAGGYQGDLREPPTYQILINYRTYQGDPKNFAEKISLENFLKLETKAAEQKIKDKIVIIGIDSEYSGDYIVTPYGKVSGLIVQAQMVSQIISTVLEKRPLIWWWPLGIDIVWISVWAGGASLMFWRLRQPIYWAIGTASIASFIGGICYVIFAFYSGWIPLIPALFASMGTSGVLTFETLRLRQGKSKNKKMVLKE